MKEEKKFGKELVGRRGEHPDDKKKRKINE